MYTTCAFLMRVGVREHAVFLPHESIHACDAQRAAQEAFDEEWKASVGSAVGSASTTQGIDVNEGNLHASVVERVELMIEQLDEV